MHTNAHAAANAEQRCQCIARNRRTKPGAPASTAVLSNGAETQRSAFAFDIHSLLCKRTVPQRSRASQPRRATHLESKCSDACSAQCW